MAGPAARDDGRHAGVKRSEELRVPVAALRAGRSLTEGVVMDCTRIAWVQFPGCTQRVGEFWMNGATSGKTPRKPSSMGGRSGSSRPTRPRAAWKGPSLRRADRRLRSEALLPAPCLELEASGSVRGREPVRRVTGLEDRQRELVGGAVVSWLPVKAKSPPRVLRCIGKDPSAVEDRLGGFTWRRPASQHRLSLAWERDDVPTSPAGNVDDISRSGLEPEGWVRRWAMA